MHTTKQVCWEGVDNTIDGSYYVAVSIGGITAYRCYDTFPDLEVAVKEVLKDLFRKVSDRRRVLQAEDDILNAYERRITSTM